MPKTIRESIAFSSELLCNVSDTPRLDAEILLACALKVDRVYLITHCDENLTEAQEKGFEFLLARRRKHEPVAYITGEREFWGLAFQVNPAVLVPRPETELLIELGLEVVGTRRGPVRVLDLGTGSGCIAVAMAVEMKKLGRQFMIEAVDISAEALDVARQNARRHAVNERTVFKQSDWFSALSDRYDLILANPPYVAEEQLMPPSLSHEPKLALFAGKDGLEAIRMLLNAASAYLQPGGSILLEIGSDQTELVREIYRDSDFSKLPSTLSVHRDLAGLDRVVKVTLQNYRWRGEDP